MNKMKAQADLGSTRSRVSHFAMPSPAWITGRSRILAQQSTKTNILADIMPVYILQLTYGRFKLFFAMEDIFPKLGRKVFRVYVRWGDGNSVTRVFVSVEWGLSEIITSSYHRCPFCINRRCHKNHHSPILLVYLRDGLPSIKINQPTSDLLGQPWQLLQGELNGLVGITWGSHGI